MTVKYAIEYKAAMEVEVEALQRVKTWTQMHNPTTYLGIQAQAVPQWFSPEIQGTIVHLQRSANRGS